LVELDSKIRVLIGLIDFLTFGPPYTAESRKIVDFDGIILEILRK